MHRGAEQEQKQELFRGLVGQDQESRTKHQPEPLHELMAGDKTRHLTVTVPVLSNAAKFSIDALISD